MLTPLAPSHVLLRKPLQDIPIVELRMKKTQKQIEELLDFVLARNNKGKNRVRTKSVTIGLSANQVGVEKRISIVDLAVRNAQFCDVHVLINPRITWYSKTKLHRREGCVNLPDIYAVIARSSAVMVSFLDRWGNSYTMRARGWPAILIQHEVDHLNGTLFIDRLADPTKAHRVKGRDLPSYRRLHKTWTKFVDVSSLVKKIS